MDVVLKVPFFLCLRHKDRKCCDCSLVWNVWGIFIDSNPLLDHQKKHTEVSHDFALVTGRLTKVSFDRAKFPWSYSLNYRIYQNNMNKSGKE